MRNDVLVNEVLAKCEVLKHAGFWPAEPRMRPRAWLNNFDTDDKGTAAFLLDQFTFYDHRLTDALLVASYHSIGDGLPKGPAAPEANELIQSLESAIFTPVTGEEPNLTDSGILFCRKARQVLSIPSDLMLDPIDAVRHAAQGKTVVFLDDFVGSGDQFIRTWRRIYQEPSCRSFENAYITTRFTAIYISLITTDIGLTNIGMAAPNVSVCSAHVLGAQARLSGLDISVSKKKAIDDLLERYTGVLTPKEDYIRANPRDLKYGYKSLGAMLGFVHSIPDATLPIFWSPGIDNWEPLIERV